MQSMLNLTGHAEHAEGKERIRTSLGALHVRVFGQGPAIVFWPSLFLPGAMWDQQAQALASNHRCIVIDPPGQGASEAATYLPTPAASAAAAVQVLDALRIESAHWVGCSWGGMVAVHAAARCPQRVLSVALLNTGTRAAHAAERLQVALLAPLVSAIGLVAPVRALVVRSFAGTLERNERMALEPILHQALRALQGRAIADNVRAVIAQREDLSALLPEIGCAALVIGGAVDPVFPPEQTRALAQGIRGARLCLLERTAHLAPIEQPRRVLDELREHLG